MVRSGWRPGRAVAARRPPFTSRRRLAHRPTLAKRPWVGDSSNNCMPRPPHGGAAGALTTTNTMAEARGVYMWCLHVAIHVHTALRTVTTSAALTKMSYAYEPIASRSRSHCTMDKRQQAQTKRREQPNLAAPAAELPNCRREMSAVAVLEVQTPKLPRPYGVGNKQLRQHDPGRLSAGLVGFCFTFMEQKTVIR